MHITLFLTHFRNNNISTVPVEIGALSRLGTLDLHSNQVAKTSHFFVCNYFYYVWKDLLYMEFLLNGNHKYVTVFALMLFVEKEENKRAYKWFHMYYTVELCYI